MKAADVRQMTPDQLDDKLAEFVVELIGGHLSHVGRLHELPLTQCAR